MGLVLLIFCWPMLRGSVVGICCPDALWVLQGRLQKKFEASPMDVRKQKNLAYSSNGALQ